MQVQQSISDRAIDAVVSAANSDMPLDNSASNPVSGERLRSFLSRIEKLEEDACAVREDIKDVYAEVKSVGFDVKIVRQIIRLRKMNPSDRREQEQLLELYLSSIGGV